MIIFSDKLTNEEYQNLPQVSGSSLVKMHQECPAFWRFGEKKQTSALYDGVAAHAAILEPYEFLIKYYSGLNKSDYPSALFTVSDMQARLKELGAKVSGSKSDVIDRLLLADENAVIWDNLCDLHKEKNQTKQEIKHETFEIIIKMRNAIFADEIYMNALQGATIESSIINEELGLKCRPDIITKNNEIWDYKTTISSNPDRFAKQAHDKGYWLKMALQHDLFEAEFGIRPKKIILLAQSKTAPFIAQAYEMTEEQLQIGRDQYQSAKRLYDECLKNNCWPSYGGGIIELPTPSYLAHIYEFENEFLTVEEIK